LIARRQLELIDRAVALPALDVLVDVALWLKRMLGFGTSRAATWFGAPGR